MFPIIGVLRSHLSTSLCEYVSTCQATHQGPHNNVKCVHSLRHVGCVTTARVSSRRANQIHTIISLVQGKSSKNEVLEPLRAHQRLRPSLLLAHLHTNTLCPMVPMLQTGRSAHATAWPLRRLRVRPLTRKSKSFSRCDVSLIWEWRRRGGDEGGSKAKMAVVRVRWENTTNH